MRVSTLSIVGCCLLVLSCETPDLQLAGELYLDLPETPYQYSGQQGDALPTLGRVLFYDRQLSLNNTVACASCHKQQFAFADNVAFSRGFEGKPTFRNSMPIQNLRPFFGFPVPFPGPRPLPQPPGISGTLFWDGREDLLQDLVMRPVADHVEMGVTDADALARKLQEVPYYGPLFEAAFGSPFPSKQNISQAIEAFMSEITSERTKLDKSFAGELQLTDLERTGAALFMTKYDCNACHQVQFTSGYIFAGTFSNIGLDEQYTDNGLSRTTKDPADAGKFKIPSLRNVALTAPYMHDGRFSSLEDVIDHYSETIANHPNLDQRLRNNTGAPLRMRISDQEKTAIIAFLHTLTDHEMITDVRFSDPFKFRAE